MRVEIKGNVYGMSRKEYKQFLKIASKAIPCGIYAAEKGSTAIMLNEKYGMTVVANLHSIDLAKEFGHRVIGVRAGQIVYDGKMEDTPESVFNDIYNGGNGKGEE